MTKSDRYINNKWSFSSLLAAIIVFFPFAAIAETSVVNNSVIAQESTSTEVVEQNIIYVNSQTGDDRSGDGTQRSPLKTITQALKLAESGTIIQLAPGTYSEETGESFPLIIKNNVTIQGSPSSQGHNVIIQGSGYFISPTAAGQNVTLVAMKEAAGIAGVTIINSHTRGHGLWIESANPQVTDNSFLRNGNTGLSVNGKSAPIITNNYFSRNAGNGLLIYGSSQPRVENNVFENTGFAVSIVQNAAPILINNRFSGNRIGVILEGNSQATLRENQIENSEEYGLVAIAQSRVDLGTVDESGNNIFRGNGKLDIQNATNNQIMAVGTEISSSTEGSIDFRGSTSSLVAADSPKRLSFSLPVPTPEAKPTPVTTTTTDNPEPLPIPSSAIVSQETLPPPKPISPPPSPTNLVTETTTNNTIPSPPLPILEEKDKQTISNNIKQTTTTKPLIGQVQTTTTTTDKNRELVFSPSNTNSASFESRSQPSPLTDSANPQEISSVSDLIGETTKYRVIVEAIDNSQQAKVRSLYPDAFSTIYQGKSMLQVGVFSSLSRAKDAMQSLQQLGLEGIILDN
jgi:parallel beta-helix repeat protein